MYRFVPTALLGALLALALLASTATASVQVGSSGWLWGNPLPQGNTINAHLLRRRPRGYAVGDFGTILATTDAGTTWTGLSSGTFTNLGIVQAIDGDSLFAGGGCVGRRSDDGGKTFKRVAFTPVESSCRQKLAAAWFVDTVTGYLVLDDGTVLRTDNNGDTFAQKIAVPGTRGGGRRRQGHRRALRRRQQRPRRDDRRQDLPHGRRRELVDVGQRRRSARSASSSSSTPRRATRSATARSSSRRTTRA